MKGTRSKPNEQLFPKQVVIQLPKISYKPYYTYSMISKNIYAEIFFQMNCLYFLSFGRN